MDDYRESIWGIRPQDRLWFQFLTLLGGTAGSIILTLLELDSLAAGAPANEVARNTALSIGASFVASGFISWGLLQAREIPMLIADWIRENTKKRVERRRQEVREELQKEMQKAVVQAREEGYIEGYSDSQEGKPPQLPNTDNSNGKDENDVSNGRLD